MYISDTQITTIQGMLEFLQPTVEDGLFDSVVLVNSIIRCTKDDIELLLVNPDGNGVFGFYPKLNASTQASGAHALIGRANKAMRCKGGFAIIDTQSEQKTFAAARTSNDKTAFMVSNRNAFTTGSGIRWHTTCYGDATSLNMYTYGYDMIMNYANDRTILNKIPVVGVYGSTDYFTTAFARSCVQFAENGLQMIGGKKYGCYGVIAILDEE